ncbi:uncharacterized protein TrAtP1_010468 [Trichoderma atroviride]|uniref:uncharacterized protein n=1 Tax=Hypocrea atroviridis TaxID=63577 RepID=UPI003328ED03|nr:hypothetical protein TrAtP1_010468 [Trichoderma atroviride]
MALLTLVQVAQTKAQDTAVHAVYPATGSKAVLLSSSRYSYGSPATRDLQMGTKPRLLAVGSFPWVTEIVSSNVARLSVPSSQITALNGIALRNRLAVSVCLAKQSSIDSPGQPTRRILEVPRQQVPRPTTTPDPIPGFRPLSAGLHLQVPKESLGYRPSL